MKRAESRSPWLVLLVLCLGFFMIMLDTTIVNIAIPSLSSNLNAGLDQILWVVNAYILVYAVLLITAGRLGDIFGQRILFMIGLAVFTLASAACAFAQTTDQLIAFRAVQGVGGALLTPQTLAIITKIFPADRRGAAFGAWGAVAGLATIAGPTLGGLLVTLGDWRWVFVINVPIGVVAVVLALFIVPDLHTGQRHHLDVAGVLISTLALVLVVFGLIEGEKFHWGSVVGPVGIWELIGAGIVIFVLFLFRERFVDEPLVPLGLFATRDYGLMNGVAAIVSFAMLGVFLPLTIYLQSVLGMTALQAGLTVLPISLVSMPVAPVAGRLADRFGGRWILVAGLAMFGAAVALVSWVATPTSTWLDLLPAFLLMGAGLGLTFAPMTTVAMREINPRMAGAASGVLNTTRQLGGVVGAALVGAVLQNQLATELHRQAVERAAALPAAIRDRIVAGFDAAVSSGLSVGRGQTGAGSSQLPAGTPSQVAEQVARVAHDIWVNGYLTAMRPTLLVPVAALALGVIAAALVRDRRVEQPLASAEPAPGSAVLDA